MDLFGGSVDSAATIGRCGETACNLREMEKALRGTFLDIQGLQYLLQSPSHTNEHGSHHMLDCWASELKKGAEMVCLGENGRKYMFLMNNLFGVLQIMRRTGASYCNAELVLTSMIQQYKKSYFDEYWSPLKNTLHLNLDKFTTEFLAICDNQRTWKVTAELKYELRQEIVDLIVPPYEDSLSAQQANGSRLSRVLSSFKRVTSGKKKQEKYTCQQLEEEIKALFEG